jgi:hybrid cluster-associated redox disulfide protein
MDTGFDSDRTIEEILARRPAAAYVLMRHRMACLGCSMARFDTLRDAARSYGIREAELLDDLAKLEP